MSAFSVVPGQSYFTAIYAAMAIILVLPLVFATAVNRILNAGWRYFGFGASVFLVFQLLTRVPAVMVLSGWVAPRIQASPNLFWVWLLALALTAGLFEEVGRYFGYRLFFRGKEKTWARALMFGLGHAAMECVYVAGTLAASVIATTGIISGSTQLSPAQHAVAAAQLAAAAAQPAWTMLIPAWERLWTIPIQVALAVIVVQLFRRKQAVWLWIAVAVHAFIDFTAPGLAHVLGAGTPAGTYVSEGLVTLFGIGALVVIWRLRDLPAEAQRVQEAPPKLHAAA